MSEKRVMVTRSLRLRIKNTAWISRCKSRWRNTSGRSVNTNQIRPSNEENKFMRVYVITSTAIAKLQQGDCLPKTRNDTLRLWFCCGFRDRDKLIYLQACAADQCPIDFRLTKEFSRVGCSH